MSKVELNALVESFSGKLGNAVLRKRGRRTYLSQKPGERSTPPNADEVAHRLRFQQAAAYGKAVLLNPAARAYYTPLTRKKEFLTVYNVAVGDYLKAPVINPLQTDTYQGQAGDVIRIPAFDSCGVTAVEVTITSAGGVVLEQGAAILPAGEVLWQYSATATNGALAGSRIEVTAKDRPGNETTRLMVL